MEIRECFFKSILSGDRLEVYDIHPMYVVATVAIAVRKINSYDLNTLMGVASKIVEANLGQISPKYTLQMEKGYIPKCNGRIFRFWLRENRWPPGTDYSSALPERIDFEK